MSSCTEWYRELLIVKLYLVHIHAMIKTILHKNLTNALTYVNTTFTLKHSCVFQPSRGLPHSEWAEAG